MRADLCINCKQNKAADGNSFCPSCQQEYEAASDAEMGLFMDRMINGDLVIDMKFFPPKRNRITDERI